MQGIVLFAIYGGDAFIASGLVVTLAGVAALAGAFDGRPRLARAARSLVVVAVTVAAFTATPLSVVTAVVAVGVTLACARYGFDRSRPGARRSLALATIVVSSLVTGREAIHLYRQAPALAAPRTLAILGDSLTSGGFGERESWIGIVAQECRIDVEDLSSPSATTDDAARNQASEIPDRAEAIVVELGGNDMLEGRDAGDFERDFDAILSAIGKRPAIVLEFPVLPGKWRFAAAQRRVSRRHGATLIPKRVLAATLTDPRNTFDGLHLNDRGHAELARRVSPWLGCR